MKYSNSQHINLLSIWSQKVFLNVFTLVFDNSQYSIFIYSFIFKFNVKKKNKCC